MTFKVKNTIVTPTLQSTVATGTAPFTVTSTTRVNNLNVATAGTADTLTTARTINGTSFNGSANITITANTPNTLTMGVSGTGLSGSATFNGGSATTFTVTSNATSANTASTIVARDASGNFSAGTITAALSGNAATATTLQTARTINNISFNGSANIVVPSDWLHSNRDFPNGTLVTTNINYAVTNGDPWVLEIRGNSYGSAVPFELQYQGYIYNNTIINHGGYSVGTSISGLVVFNSGGNLCFWWPNQSYWHGYNVRVYIPYSGYPTNRVTSIANVAKPGSITKEIALSANIRIVLRSDNYNNYSPTLTGGGASGTWGINITGNAATAATATTLQNARTINGTSFNGSSNITTNSWGTSRTITIGSTGKSVNGSANVSWSIAEMGVAALGGAIADLNTSWTAPGTSISNGLYLYRYDSSASNKPASSDNANWVLNIYSHQTGGTASYGHQISAVNTENLYFRSVSNGSFSSWRTLLHSNNFTSYSPTLTGSGASGTWGISITGNAATVTNGVYTNGSYADPAWITSLAKSKVGLGNVENTALSTWSGSTNITTIGAATATSLTVTGNLTINGTTTTVNSTTVSVDDPIFTLGGDTAPTTDDNKDRGIEFRWHNGTASKVGFFGYDDSTGYFTFIPDATNTSEVFSGTQGDIQAANFRGALVGNASTASAWATGRTITIGNTGKTVDGSGNVTWTLSEIGAYSSSNPSGYTSNAGTVTSVGGTGTVSGLTLSGTVTTSGNLTLSGTLSASIDNITDEHRIFNNMGGNHAARTSFDATTPSYNFGWRFVQGNTNGPGVNNAGQYYSLYVGLGNDYLATGAGSYGMQIAIPRNVTTPYLAVRYNENNSLGSWQKISAGRADTLTTARTINGTSFDGSANITITANTPNTITFNNGGSGAASGSTFNGSSALTVSHNTIGAPSTTGTGASGTWGINITGNAANVTGIIAIANGGTGASTAANARINLSAAQGTQVLGSGYNFNNTTPAHPLLERIVWNTGDSNMSNGPSGNTTGLLIASQGSHGLWNAQAFLLQGASPEIYLRGSSDAGGTISWGTWRTVLHSSNYNSYAPTLTGTGASGTWGISVTGNAATATTLQTTRTIWGQNFNGGGNVSGSLSSVGDITGTGAVNLTATGGTLGLAATGSNVVTVSTNATERLRIAANGALGLSGANYGTSGQVLTSNGSGSAPSWQAAGGSPSMVVVTATTQTAVANTHYVLTNAALTTVTLPTSPAAGDIVWVTVGNDLTTNVIARGGEKIMGLTEDMTIDTQNATIQLRFVNTTLGWRIL